MAVKEYFTLHRSQAETTAGPFASVAGLPQQHFLGNYEKARFYLAVTAISGTTPSLTVWIEEWDLQSETWVFTAGFTAQTAITSVGSNGSDGTAAKNALVVDVNPLMAQMYRANWSISGTTPSATFTLGVWCGSSESAIA